MSKYEPIISKEFNFNVSIIKDEIDLRRKKDFFWPTGTQIYVGDQGSGKTISAVKHVFDMIKKYPKVKVVTNLELDIDHEQIYEFQTRDELAKLLVSINNGYYGVIYLIDEIHTYFNALESANIPMYVFTEISQQRKQRKLIIGTSQRYLRTAKPFREQADSIILCKTTLNIFTSQKMYPGKSNIDEDGYILSPPKKTGYFYHTRQYRELFDTYQKVVSGAEQYKEQTAGEILEPLVRGEKKRGSAPFRRA